MFPGGKQSWSPMLYDFIFLVTLFGLIYSYVSFSHSAIIKFKLLRNEVAIYGNPCIAISGRLKYEKLSDSMGRRPESLLVVDECVGRKPESNACVIDNYSFSN